MVQFPAPSEALPSPEQHLIEAHLDLAAQRAGALALREGYNPDEAYSDALIGLWKAAQRYNPDHAEGASFGTFAEHKIDGAIRDGFREYHGRRYNRPSVLLNDSAVSLDTPVDPLAGTSPSLGDTLLSPDLGPEEIVTDALHDRNKIDALTGLIVQLPVRQAEALQLHLSGLTYKEIGEKMGISESGAKHAQARAVKTLRGLYDQRN